MIPLETNTTFIANMDSFKEKKKRKPSKQDKASNRDVLEVKEPKIILSH